jgi:TonB family protein
MTISPVVRPLVVACQAVALALSASSLAQGQMLSAPPAVNPKVQVEEVFRIVAPRSMTPPRPEVPALDEPFDDRVPRFMEGGGLTAPIPTNKPSPPFTPEALVHRVQGAVDLDVIVRADGTVGAARIIKSLDRVYGMDAEAIKAAKAWRFRPARDASGNPTPVIVTIGFDLRLGSLQDFESVLGRRIVLKTSGPRGATIVKPRRASGVPPIYPDAARQKRVQGTVEVEAYTNLDGEVVYVRLKKSVPDLDQAVLDAVRTWRYTRTTLNREYTETLITVKMTFVLN